MTAQKRTAARRRRYPGPARGEPRYFFAFLATKIVRARATTSAGAE